MSNNLKYRYFKNKYFEVSVIQNKEKFLIVRDGITLSRGTEEEINLYLKEKNLKEILNTEIK